MGDHFCGVGYILGGKALNQHVVGTFPEGTEGKRVGKFALSSFGKLATMFSQSVARYVIEGKRECTENPYGKICSLEFMECHSTQHGGGSDFGLWVATKNLCSFKILPFRVT